MKRDSNYYNRRINISSEEGANMMTNFAVKYYGAIQNGKNEFNRYTGITNLDRTKFKMPNKYKLYLIIPIKKLILKKKRNENMKKNMVLMTIYSIKSTIDKKTTIIKC